MFSRTVLLTNTDATTLARHAYSYQYDGRNRCIEKKLPGCETVRLIYDRADRLVLEQNGTQRAGNRWTVHKYDAIGRLLYSFEHTDATDIATLRNRLSGICATESDSGNAPLGIGYTNTTVGWGSDVRLLEVNYYDDYSFLDKLTSAERNALTYAARSGYDTCHTYADGLPTGNRHYLPDGTGRYVATALYYDSKGRTVQQTRTNLKGGYDRDSYANSFTGQVTKHFYTHTGSASDTGSPTCEYFYMYDSNDRLVAVDCALNGGTRSALYRLSYDSYGRMQQKTFGNGLYTGTYDYNLRGWLTGISGSKFSQALHYTDGPGTPCYNGNISSMTWKAGNETMLRGYKFTYDGLNRMLDAIYGEGTNIGSNANRFTEKVTGYDKNGNILALQRYGQTGTSSYGLIDNLTFTLDGNQLNRVDDAVTASAYNGGFEFKDTVKQANEYAYDANGNLTKDLNKNISNIQYNCLNLPSKVTFTDGSTIEYTYATDGTKLRTKHVINGTTTTTDYCGNVIYENGVQKLLLTEAGYVTLSDSKYHYYLQDHQGNNRVVIDQNGTVEETNHYYPFGGVFANSTSVQPYKYNGKELDTKKGLNWYDYGARHYDAAVGRFHTQDRFAEKYYPMSPYQYAANCPMKNIDVNGDSIVVLNYTEGEHLGMLIQDDSQQWRYYSFNGDKIYNMTDGSIGGGPIDNKGEKSWESPQDFLDDDYNRATNQEDLENGIVNGYGYKEGYLIPTNQQQDRVASQTFIETVDKGYSLLNNQCSMAVQKALNAAGIETGRTYYYHSVGTTIKGSYKEYNPYLPSSSFKAIIQNNRNGFLIKRK